MQFLFYLTTPDPQPQKRGFLLRHIVLDRAAILAWAICTDLYRLFLGWASLKIKTIMKSLALLLAIPFSLLGKFRGHNTHLLIEF